MPSSISKLPNHGRQLKHQREPAPQPDAIFDWNKRHIIARERFKRVLIGLNVIGDDANESNRLH